MCRCGIYNESRLDYVEKKRKSLYFLPEFIKKKKIVTFLTNFFLFYLDYMDIFTRLTIEICIVNYVNMF